MSEGLWQVVTGPSLEASPRQDDHVSGEGPRHLAEHLDVQDCFQLQAVVIMLVERLYVSFKCADYMCPILFLTFATLLAISGPSGPPSPMLSVALYHRESLAPWPEGPHLVLGHRDK